MGTYSSYWLYQKYIIIGNQDPIPVIPLTYSVSGDSLDPQPLVIKLENDPQCGYVPPVEYQYRDIESGYTCVDFDKYTKIVRQRSSDGIHWENVSYSAGTLIEHNSTDCGYVGELYRWVNSGTTCYEGDKYIRIIQQVSYDGINWTNTGEEARGTMIEADSPDCIEYRWVDMDISTDWICDECPDITYRWVVVQGEYECSGTTKMTKEKKQYSIDSGTTWQDVTPPEYRTGSTVIEYDSTDCGYIPSYSKQYLTFIPTSGSSTFGWNSASGSASGNTVYYSLDSGSTWISMASGETVTVNEGKKIYWKATNLVAISGSNGGIGHFSSSGKFDVEGNIMSLVSGDSFVSATTVTNNQFRNLFNGCTNVVNANYLVLPATTLANGCYGNMFLGCTSLTTAPELPATTLTTQCYGNMFLGCTSLTTAPSLPATTLANACYQQMFLGCTSLTTAPELPATTLKSACYEEMFKGCSSLTTAPSLPATTLAYCCYNMMFSNCTSLTTAPELPATTLANDCYFNMFFGCTGLTTAPELPATTLADYCYYNMFRGCTNLNYIKCLATDISASSCTTNWVNNVAPSGTFVKASSMSSWTTGNNGIPSNWTIQNY